jgi:hypothetical protein
MLKEKKIGLLLAEEASVTLWEEVHAQEESHPGFQ